jgi:Protein of unknown function (DUF2568)
LLEELSRRVSSPVYRASGWKERGDETASNISSVSWSYSREPSVASCSQHRRSSPGRWRLYKVPPPTSRYEETEAMKSLTPTHQGTAEASESRTKVGEGRCRRRCVEPTDNRKRLEREEHAGVGVAEGSQPGVGLPPGAVRSWRLRLLGLQAWKRDVLKGRPRHRRSAAGRGDLGRLRDAARAAVPVPELLRFVIQALFFGLAAVALYAGGHRAIAFGLLVMVNGVMVRL